LTAGGRAIGSSLVYGQLVKDIRLHGQMFGSGRLLASVPLPANGVGVLVGYMDKIRVPCPVCDPDCRRPCHCRCHDRDHDDEHEHDRDIDKPEDLLSEHDRRVLRREPWREPWLIYNEEWKREQCEGDGDGDKLEGEDHHEHHHEDDEEDDDENGW